MKTFIRAKVPALIALTVTGSLVLTACAAPAGAAEEIATAQAVLAQAHAELDEMLAQIAEIEEAEARAIAEREYLLANFSSFDAFLPFAIGISIEELPAEFGVFTETASHYWYSEHSGNTSVTWNSSTLEELGLPQFENISIVESDGQVTEITARLHHDEELEITLDQIQQIANGAAAGEVLAVLGEPTEVSSTIINHGPRAGEVSLSTEWRDFGNDGWGGSINFIDDEAAWVNFRKTGAEGGPTYDQLRALDLGMSTEQVKASLGNPINFQIGANHSSFEWGSFSAGRGTVRFGADGATDINFNGPSEGIESVTPAQLQQIRLGMSKAEVYAVLGTPNSFAHTADARTDAGPTGEWESITWGNFDGQVSVWFSDGIDSVASIIYSDNDGRHALNNPTELDWVGVYTGTAPFSGWPGDHGSDAGPADWEWPEGEPFENVTLELRENQTYVLTLADGSSFTGSFSINGNTFTLDQENLPHQGFLDLEAPLFRNTNRALPNGFFRPWRIIPTPENTTDGPDEGWFSTNLLQGTGDFSLSVPAGG